MKKREEEDYLKAQSLILQESLDFWQEKVVEQIDYIDLLEADESCSEGNLEAAGQELHYLMSRLGWNTRFMEVIEEKIKLHFKKKKK